ncbi:hypothetical protein C8034_v003452 [Colletotrichum sidae]|uniref:Uncharacterized protein n=1 Tax=Colletotrichum sidae TaxID=1347389 RepID=A0A4R8TAC1_9PEZI|nr:hypothetical protein C8034_v003452 [Colletotrichum sidae]
MLLSGAESAWKIIPALSSRDIQATVKLDAYYEFVMARVAHVAAIEPVRDTAWGYRQFSIEDEDGNTLTFFRFLVGGNLGPEGGWVFHALWVVVTLYTIL